MSGVGELGYKVKGGATRATVSVRGRVSWGTR